MANVLLSPGVLAIENDQSFIRQQPVTVGAAIIGPTVKGPVELPTIVTSYSDYVSKFGDVLLSGSDTYSYFTSIAAYNYFNNNGLSLLVARVVSGSYSPAISTTINSNILATTASANAEFTYLHTGAASVGSASFSVRGITFTVTGSSLPTNTSTAIYVSSGSSAANTTTAVVAAFNASASVSPYNTSLQYITSSVSASTGILFNSTTGVNGLTGNTYSFISGSTTVSFTGGTNQPSFVLETISEGVIMNSSGSEDSAGALVSGSVNNIRWQIINPVSSSGQFTILIRQGDDVTNSPTVLETFTVSLDPFTSNYISKVIGDYIYNYNPSTNQIELSGSYPNGSRYIRVKSVNQLTPNYFDNNGQFKSQYTASLPIAQSGSFTGATGDVKAGTKFWNEIEENNSQGLVAANYTNMINLLSNQDDYRFNILFTPGLIDEFTTHTSKISTIINNTQERGDNIYVVDLVGYASTAQEVISQASSRDTSYAAAYWPWCQIVDPATGKNVWVPASTMIAGVYSNNDYIAEPWFAPAGINRGGLSTVIRVEQKLSQSTRDNLYQNKVNPIATFPGQGIVVYGQKTLQLKASALDRVNVRRLLIALKSYISQVANTLVFEQNTIATRNSFLSQVDPYLASVQQRQGLYAFRIVMDDSNNTPDVIDRNQLVGQIYLQPTKTAEFIYLTFNITPTGVTFD
jgi:phage tail sheath protein FI